jgi:uncharacterized membrane protein YfcA
MWVEFALIGVAAGFLAVVLGIGGGFAVVLALAFLFLSDPETAPRAVHMAVATSLSTMLVTSLSSVFAHHRRRAISWGLVRSMTPGLLGGAVAGAVLADFMDGALLLKVFGSFAILIGLQLIVGPQVRATKPAPTQPGLTGVAALIGSISSLVGIGGGSMTVPWLLWHGVRAQQAVATAAACGYPIAVAGTLSFILLGRNGTDAALGYVNLQAFIGIAAFSALVAPVGAAAVHRLPPQAVRRIFGLFLIFVGTKMLAGI